MLAASSVLGWWSTATRIEDEAGVLGWLRGTVLAHKQVTRGVHPSLMITTWLLMKALGRRMGEIAPSMVGMHCSPGMRTHGFRCIVIRPLKIQETREKIWICKVSKATMRWISMEALMIVDTLHKTCCQLENLLWLTGIWEPVPKKFCFYLLNHFWSLHLVWKLMIEIDPTACQLFNIMKATILITILLIEYWMPYSNPTQRLR